MKYKSNKINGVDIVNEGKKGSTPVLATTHTPAALHLSDAVLSPGQKTGHNNDMLMAEFLTYKNFEPDMCNYTKAKLSATGFDWFVFYQYRHPLTGKFKRFKERFNMNRIADLRQRREYGNEAVKFLNEKLAKGFNPFTAERSSGTGDALVLTRVHNIVNELSESGTKHQQSTYKLMFNRLKRFVDQEGLGQLTLGMWQVEHCSLMQQWMKSKIDKPLKPKTNNTTISHLGLLWDEAIRRNWVADNPWRKIKQLRKTANQGEDIFAPLTFEEISKVFEFLRMQNMHGFIRFLAFIYYAWARPVEICRLQVQDVDLENNLIFFRTGETKNDKSATVQIVPELRAYILEMQLHLYPAENYLFNSKTYEPGGTISTVKYAGKLWARMIHQRLGIHKAMYALKHTGNIDYLVNNKGAVDRTWQQMQNRHSSLSMTENYCRRLNAYFLDTTKIKFRKL